MDCCIPEPPAFPELPPPDPSAFMELGPSFSGFCDGVDTGDWATTIGSHRNNAVNVNGVLVIPFMPGDQGSMPDRGADAGGTGGGGTEFSPTFALIVSAIVFFLLTGFTTITVILYCKRRRLKPCKSSSTLAYSSPPRQPSNGPLDPSATHWVFNSLVLDNSHKGIPHTQSVLEATRVRLASSATPKPLLHNKHVPTTMPHHSASFCLHDQQMMSLSSPGTPHSCHPAWLVAAQNGRDPSHQSPHPSTTSHHRFPLSLPGVARPRHGEETNRSTGWGAASTSSRFRDSISAGAAQTKQSTACTSNCINCQYYDPAAVIDDHDVNQYNSLSLHGPIYEEISVQLVDLDQTQSRRTHSSTCRNRTLNSSRSCSKKPRLHQKYDRSAQAQSHDGSDESSCSNISLLPADHSPQSVQNASGGSSSVDLDNDACCCRHANAVPKNPTAQFKAPPNGGPLYSIPPLNPNSPLNPNNCSCEGCESSGGRESGYSTQGCGCVISSTPPHPNNRTLNDHSHVSADGSYDSPPMPLRQNHTTGRFGSAPTRPPGTTTSNGQPPSAAAVKMRTVPSSIKTNPLIAYNRGSRHLSPAGDFV